VPVISLEDYSFRALFFTVTAFQPCPRQLFSLALTSARLRYHDLRGLRRGLSVDLPVKRSQVHLTSLAVNGLPSCHLTPSRNRNGQLSPIRAPGPAGGEIGHDRLHAVLFYVLVEHDEVC
jgi:hypothetical protein